MDKQMSDQNIDQEKQENSRMQKQNKLRSGRKSSLDFRKYDQCRGARHADRRFQFLGA